VSYLPGIDAEDLQTLAEVVQQAQDYFDRARKEAETYISIEPPWDYNPEDYSPSEDAQYIALKWTVEGREHLRESGIDELQTLSGRIEEGDSAVVQEVSEDGETPYKGLFLLLSSLDGLIIWLCESDPEIEYSYTNEAGEPIYGSSKKRDAIEKWYSEYSIFGVEDDQGSEFKEKWRSFWNHRHRVMHGSPHAYYDLNIVVSTLFFVGLVSHVVAERAEDLE